jgi:uncharacterized metal-binding protein (TIGR02443 family)
MSTLSHSSPRRFIAGAVCPRCSAMDKLVLYRNDEGIQLRECIACGFRESITEQGQMNELPTRVNQPRVGEKPLPHEDEIMPVKFLDPDN